MNMMRRFGTVAFIVAAVGLSQSSNAQTGAAPQKTPQADVCWQNAATGKPVPKENLVPNGATLDPTDPDRASQAQINPGQPGSIIPGNPPIPPSAPNTINYVRGADGSWSNAATGQPIPNGNLVPNGATLDPTDPDRASQAQINPGQPGSIIPGNPPIPPSAPNTINYVRVPCPPQTVPQTPPTKVAQGPGAGGMGFTPSVQIRGFGGATIVNGNTPCATGFDGAVLFPLGNRVLVGPTGGFEWICSSLVMTIGGGPPPSTFINQSVGFKNGNFGGRIAFPFGGWQLGIHGGATVAGSTITQNGGVCLTSGCTISSTAATHDTEVGPFVGGYISHLIFSHVGVFVEYDYHRLKDTKSSVSVFDLRDSDVVAGLLLSFGRHKAK
jgi:hypothetical protein